MTDRIIFNELSRAKIKDKRFAVISKNNINKGFTIAQQLVIAEDSGTLKVFIKGSMHIDGLEGLYNLRDAINVAVEKVESQQSWPS